MKRLGLIWENGIREAKQYNIRPNQSGIQSKPAGESACSSKQKMESFFS
jgi:hypothetical protein